MWIVLFGAAALVAYQAPWFKFDVDDEGTVLDYQLSGNFNGYPELAAAANATADNFPFFWVFAGLLTVTAITYWKWEDADERAGVILFTGVATFILTGASYLMRGWITGASKDLLDAGVSIGADSGLWLMLGLSVAIFVCGIAMSMRAPDSEDAAEAHHD